MATEPDPSRAGWWLVCGHPVDDHCACHLDRPKRSKDRDLYGSSGDYGKTGRVRRLKDDQGAAWPITGHLCDGCGMPMIACDSGQLFHPTCEPTMRKEPA